MRGRGRSRAIAGGDLRISLWVAPKSASLSMQGILRLVYSSVVVLVWNIPRTPTRSLLGTITVLVLHRQRVHTPVRTVRGRRTKVEKDSTYYSKGLSEKPWSPSPPLIYSERHLVWEKGPIPELHVVCLPKFRYPWMESSEGDLCETSQGVLLETVVSEVLTGCKSGIV